MKIAFTTSGNDMAAPMDPRFGRAARFLIFDAGTGGFVLIDNAGIDAAQGAGLKAAETIVKAGATVLVTGECGPKALNVLKQAGVKVYTAKAVSVSEALEDFRAGRLSEVTGA
jgi:predicted Fe-Mo cluster-binding NifX family protein